MWCGSPCYWQWPIPSHAAWHGICPARQSIFGSMEMGELYLQLVIDCDLCDFACIVDLQKSSGYGSLHCILFKFCTSWMLFSLVNYHVRCTFEGWAATFERDVAWIWLRVMLADLAFSLQSRHLESLVRAFVHLALRGRQMKEMLRRTIKKLCGKHL